MSKTHEHDFADGEWPFSCPVATPAFSSARVVHEGHPILAAFHDHDGDWQFLHGEITDEDEVAVVCMGCAFEIDRTLGELADLPSGWEATRDEVEQPWRRQPYDEPVDDDDDE